jgi:hypothetical protein
MGELAAAPTQWPYDDAAGARDEILRNRKKFAKKALPPISLKADQGAKPTLEIEPEFETNGTLDILA